MFSVARWFCNDALKREGELQETTCSVPQQVRLPGNELFSCKDLSSCSNAFTEELFSDEEGPTTFSFQRGDFLKKIDVKPLLSYDLTRTEDRLVAVKNIAAALREKLPRDLTPRVFCSILGYVLQSQCKWKVTWLSDDESSLKVVAKLPPGWADTVLAVAPPGQAPCMIDCAFRSKFEIPRAIPQHIQLLKDIPECFVGSLNNLTFSLSALSMSTFESFNANGLTLPPWRSKKLLVKLYTGLAESVTLTVENLEKFTSLRDRLSAGENSTSLEVLRVVLGTFEAEEAVTKARLMYHDNSDFELFEFEKEEVNVLSEEGQGSLSALISEVCSKQPDCESVSGCALTGLKTTSWREDLAAYWDSL